MPWTVGHTSTCEVWKRGRVGVTGSTGLRGRRKPFGEIPAASSYIGLGKGNDFGCVSGILNDLGPACPGFVLLGEALSPSTAPVVQAQTQMWAAGCGAGGREVPGPTHRPCLAF